MYCFSLGETIVIHTISFESIIGLCASEHISGIAAAIVCSHRKIRKNNLSILSILYSLPTGYQENGVSKNDIKAVKKTPENKPPLHFLYIFYCYYFLSSP